MPRIGVFHKYNLLGLLSRLRPKSSTKAVKVGTSRENLETYSDSQASVSDQISDCISLHFNLENAVDAQYTLLDTARVGVTSGRGIRGAHSSNDDDLQWGDRGLQRN